jgi:hypothetical protein
MIVELNIFCLHEDQIVIQETGGNVPFKECIVRKYGFINIDYFSPRRDSPEYTTIGSGGDEFICNEQYEAVKLKIQQASLFKLN